MKPNNEPDIIYVITAMANPKIFDSGESGYIKTHSFNELSDLPEAVNTLENWKSTLKRRTKNGNETE